MAGNLKTSYDASNFVLTQDYSYRFNQLDVGKPEVVAQYDPQTQQTTVQSKVWKRAIMDETAGFKYIGMDYATAKACAAYLRTQLTCLVYAWEFGWYIENNLFQYGWFKSYSTPTLDSEIRVEQRSGCMYDVVVNARCTSTNYTTNSAAVDTGSRPLYNSISSLPGWSSAVTLTGHHFDAASASNISLVTAPTQNVTFELVGQNVITSDPQAQSGLSIDNWYRATTDQYAQVKYEGMTKAACRSLFNTLNETTGWWLQYHPWIFDCTWDSTTNKWTLGWRQDTTTNVYQCLNDFKATEDESGMFTAEISLHAQRIEMTKNPTNYTPPAYPALWSSKIPGMNKFL